MRCARPRRWAAAWALGVPIAALAAFATLAACRATPDPAGGADIRLVDGTRFELRTVPQIATGRADPDWARTFPVRVASAGSYAPAMLGTYERADGVLRFTPAFPLAAGVRYRATYVREPGSHPLTREFVVQKPPAGPRVYVEQVYPSSAVLPENVLRFYLQFSGPMSQGVAYEYVALRDDAGAKIDMPFLEVAEELWNPQGTRLTLLIDPGRIKNQLLPKRQIGPVFRADHSYTLVINGGWPDATGRPLARGFRRELRIGPIDVTQPDPRRWQIRPPGAGSRSPLVLEFPRALDHGVLQRMIAVVGPDGRPVSGTIRIREWETRWSLLPDKPWAAGRHHLVVDPELEDPCGNSVASKFEVDVSRPRPRGREQDAVRVAFEVK